MEGLVNYPFGQVNTDFQPALAESWDVSEDGTVYTFALRKGVHWHDGFGEFTADDVKFSLDRYRDPNVSPWASAYANVTSVEVVNTHTARVILKEADPFFLSSVASDTESIGLMVCKKAFEERGDQEMRLRPVGTGPFKFKEYVPKDKVVMISNDAYWDGSPQVDELVIRFIPSPAARELAMNTGEIDSMRAALDGQVITRLSQLGYIVDNKGPEINWWLHINTEVEPLNDIRVRRAISYAINAADFEILLGKVATAPDQLIGPAYFGAASPEDFAEDTKWGYDPERAKALLAEAGYPDGFNLSMIISERDDYRQMMILMQEHLKKVGINVELNRVDHAFYHSQIVKYVNPFVLYGDISFPNAEIMLARAARSGATRNFSRWSDESLDALLDQVAATTDLEERRKLLIEAQQKVAEASIIVPAVFTGQPLVRNKRVDLGYELKASLGLEYRYNHLTRLRD